MNSARYQTHTEGIQGDGSIKVFFSFYNMTINIFCRQSEMAPEQLCWQIWANNTFLLPARDSDLRDELLFVFLIHSFCWAAHLPLCSRNCCACQPMLPATALDMPKANCVGPSVLRAQPQSLWNLETWLSFWILSASSSPFSLCPSPLPVSPIFLIPIVLLRLLLKWQQPADIHNAQCIGFYCLFNYATAVVIWNCDQENIIHATNLGLNSRNKGRTLGVKWELIRRRKGSFFPNIFLFLIGSYWTGVFCELHQYIRQHAAKSLNGGHC